MHVAVRVPAVALAGVDLVDPELPTAEPNRRAGPDRIAVGEGALEVEENGLA